MREATKRPDLKLVSEHDWLDERPATLADRINILKAEKRDLDDTGMARFGSHREIMREVDRLATEIRALEVQQNLEIARDLGIEAAKEEADAVGLLAIGPPSDILAREFPPREYAWSHYYPTKACAALIGEGAVGKSILAVTQALHSAAGLPFLGQPTIPGTTIYFSAEDDPQEVWRRVQRIVRRMPPESQQLAIDNFRLIDAVGKRMYFVASGKDGVAQIGAVVKRIADYIAGDFPDTTLVLIDTISRINGGAENSNETMAAIVDAGERIAQATGAAVVLLHHTSKAGAREGIDDLHAGRGGSSLGDNARAVIRLMPAQESHCRGLDISTDERRRGNVLRLVHAKNSYGPRLEVVWLRRGIDGTLEQFEPGKVDPAARAAGRMELLLKWAAEQTVPFNISMIRDSEMRTNIWGDGVTEPAAREIYKQAIDEGHLLDSDVKRSGYPMQQINPATAERILTEAAELSALFDSEGEA